MGYSIRKFNYKDIQTLISLRIDEQRELYGNTNIYDKFYDDLEKYFENCLKDTNKIIVVCCKDKNIIGTLSFNI